MVFSSKETEGGTATTDGVVANDFAESICGIETLFLVLSSENILKKTISY
jgi:hypothetical protein